MFRHILFHEVLFRFHVLGEISLPEPSLPPYYDKEFFNTIKHYHETSPLNIAVMTTKQWYKVLLEDKVLMTSTNETLPRSLIPARVEALSPLTDWSTTWTLARTRGLGSDLTAILFKILHQLLPTQDRVSRLTRNQTQNTGLCQLCYAEVEDQKHAFFSCPYSSTAGSELLEYVHEVLPDLSPEAALRLEFSQELSEEEQLATVCLLTTGLQYIWSARVEKKPAILYKMRADIEAQIAILRRTRHKAAGDLMAEMIE